MSLYQMLHGTNPYADVFLLALEIDQPKGKWSSGRFRDVYLNKEGTEITLYTRNGGGNREHYNDESDEGEDCMCTGCIIQYHLPKHPNYLRDWDDDFDSTYAYIAFSIPEDYKALVSEYFTGKDPKTISEKFKDTMDEMKNKTSDELKKDPKFGEIARLFGEIVQKNKEE